MTSTGCAKDWTAASAGPQTFTVANQSSKAGEATLVNAAGAVAAAGSAGTALAGGVLIGGARADGSTAQAPSAPRSYPFHGTHHAGVLTPGPAGKQSFACFAAFDSIAGSKAELAGLMQVLTQRARFLTSGGTPPDLGIGQPPSDSNVLGPSVPADGLTVTTSVGSSLFDERFGLGQLKSRKLTPMRAFPNDSPDPAWLAR